MRRLFAAYNAVAIISFNAVILGLLVCLGISLALDWRHRLSGQTTVTPSIEIDLESFREVDSARAKDIVRELDVYASSQPFAFNPWATFMQAPYAGDTINVEDDAVLTHRHVPPSPVQAEKRFVVWAFGGSTLFGWGVDDRHTIPAFLQEELQRRLPSRRVEVVNFGQPYWYSSSEVAGFLALLRSRPAPQAVVFLDGLNDASWVSSGLTVPVLAGQARAAWDRARADSLRQLPWFSLNSSFPLARILNWLSYHRIIKPVAEDDGYHHPVQDPAQAIISTYQTNRQLATAMAATRDVRAFFFLQPVPWMGKWGEGRVNRSFTFGDKDQAAKAMRVLTEEADGETVRNFHSLTEALRDMDRPFVDGTHYSDAANRVLATKMAEIVAAPVLLEL